MDVDSYAESLAVQLRKGFLVYCVLLVCSNKAQYAGDIVKQLNDSDLTVVEGTIYPLLYYSLTDHGDQLIHELKDRINMLNNSLDNLEKGIK